MRRQAVEGGGQGAAALVVGCLLGWGSVGPGEVVREVPHRRAKLRLAQQVEQAVQHDLPEPRQHLPLGLAAELPELPAVLPYYPDTETAESGRRKLAPRIPGRGPDSKLITAREVSESPSPRIKRAPAKSPPGRVRFGGEVFPG